MDEILDEVTKEPSSINVSTLKKRRGAAERKSYDNSFKMSVINQEQKKESHRSGHCYSIFRRQIAFLKMEEAREKDMRCLSSEHFEDAEKKSTKQKACCCIRKTLL